MIDFAAQMQVCLPNGLAGLLGVAVSGGGDSTALLLLLADWAKRTGTSLLVASVDHGLRPEARDEIAAVDRLCADLGVSHFVLRWADWDGLGNLQDKARQARHRLLADWAAAHGVGTIALGHTRDDQAETVLMRLLRGSGVDGLSGMAQISHRSEITWIRPLLHHSREDLRGFLRDLGVGWSDDPSNENDAFDRIKIRKTMAAMGLTPKGLAETAVRMQTTRRFLEAETLAAARSLARISAAGDVVLNSAGFFSLSDEIQQRLMAHSLQWVSTAPYRPRLENLHNLLIRLKNREKSTLAGCVLTPNNKGTIDVSREYAAVQAAEGRVGQLWDQRWRVAGPSHATDNVVRALGETGLNSCPDWRQTGLSRNALIAGPAVWQDQQLVAAPLAGWPQGWACSLQKGPEHYFSSILSH